LTTRFASAIFVFVSTINNNYTKSGSTKEKNGIPEQDNSKETPCLQSSLLNEKAIAPTQESHLFLIKRPGINKVAQDKTRID
jgi:hypothetical protein